MYNKQKKLPSSSEQHFLLKRPSGISEYKNISRNVSTGAEEEILFSFSKLNSLQARLRQKWP